MRATSAAAVSSPPVGHPTFGVDCADITPCEFAPIRVEFSTGVEEAFYRSSAPLKVEATPLSWFREARSQADGLRLAFGDAWCIALLPSTTPQTASMFLLTNRRYGHRMLVRMRRIHYRSWCNQPTEATGHLGFLVGRRTRRTLCEDRRDWLASEVRNVTAAEDLLGMVRLTEARATNAVAGDADRAQAQAIVGALAEVWLAETGASEETRMSVRTMVTLGTPLSTFMAGSPVCS